MLILGEHTLLSITLAELCRRMSISLTAVENLDDLDDLDEDLRMPQCKLFSTSSPTSRPSSSSASLSSSGPDA